MQPYAIKVVYPGAPNPEVPLTVVQVCDLRAAIAQLAEPPAAAHRCWSGCEERRDVVFVLGAAVEDVIFFSNRTVVIGQRVLLDDKGQLDALARPILAIPDAGIPAASLAANVPAFAMLAKHPYRCTHPAGYHDAPLRRCKCGVPDDFDTWAASGRLLHNSCYNYAVRDVWCEDGRGAQPAGYPDDLSDASAWAKILKRDGLYLTDDCDRSPDGASGKGWHVALLVNDTAHHFLRLDGDQWTHKMSTYPPQACDTRGNRIPSDSLRSADLCDYEFVAYFWVPGPRRINHWGLPFAGGTLSFLVAEWLRRVLPGALVP